VSNYSKNERAEKIMGRRSEGIAIDLPCEWGYHCPVCEYPLTMGEDYDERLDWSEYHGFIWCEVCNRDYPSALCQPEIDRAIETLLDTVEAAAHEAVAAERKRWLCPTCQDYIGLASRCAHCLALLSEDPDHD
jgi:RNase P subunit RPR2